ncbi:hypothetical protein MDOR_26990 [Mycolicibacterium doricum]|uniref:Uncharacterized protein n=1 Tax=Mycolicibacterium doricum TaxID=126673 RepID=A0A1X1TL00_9MYCO|nr:hypothetical protein [Mycolicibacterium doricum]MCV7269978.1 hypothetical protein [Mycolicibacterium doricum]ORV45230.1 hypothetical protein AWC01_01675 [Mycolicibacterium doricum]BBZ08530.1 hypothetical protein MDOR_26990 [Mycolicibacterium doricum]
MTLRRLIARVFLGASLVFTGIGHLTFARTDFYAQVPPWPPLNVLHPLRKSVEENQHVRA